MRLTRKITNTIYYFSFASSDLKEERQQFVVESTSKTDAIDYFFDFFQVNHENINYCNGMYVDKNGILKKINLKKAFSRRFFK